MATWMRLTETLTRAPIFSSRSVLASNKLDEQRSANRPGFRSFTRFSASPLAQ